MRQKLEYTTEMAPMLSRLLEPPLNQNVLVFGPRGSWKKHAAEKNL